MPTYQKETAVIPSLVIIRPSYDTTGAVDAVTAQFNWIQRVKNDADAADQLPAIESGSKSVDLFVTNKSVTVTGLGAITYRQIAQALKKVGDAERGV